MVLQKKKKKLVKSKRIYKRKFPSEVKEKEIQRNILCLLEIKHIPHARINSGFIFTGKYRIKLAPEGFPDILFFYRGVHAVEVKRVGENLRPLQLEWKAVLLSNGVGYLTASSVEEVEEYLSKLSTALPTVVKPLPDQHSM